MDSIFNKGHWNVDQYKAMQAIDKAPFGVKERALEAFRRVREFRGRVMRCMARNTGTSVDLCFWQSEDEVMDDQAKIGKALWVYIDPGQAAKAFLVEEQPDGSLVESEQVLRDEEALVSALQWVRN